MLERSKYHHEDLPYTAVCEFRSKVAVWLGLNLVTMVPKFSSISIILNSHWYKVKGTFKHLKPGEDIS